MKLQRRNIYISLAFLLLIFLVEWIEEALVTEGIFAQYFHGKQELLILLLVRGSNLIVVFLIGYIGLSFLQFSWVKKIWIIWNLIVILAAVMRMFPVILFNSTPTINQLTFLSSFYTLGMSPFPYLFLWMFAVIFLPYLKQAKEKQSLDSKSDL